MQNSIYGPYYDTNNYLFPQNIVELVQHYTRSKQTHSTINIMLMIFNKNAAYQNELEKKHMNFSVVGSPVAVPSGARFTIHPGNYKYFLVALSGPIDSP